MSPAGFALRTAALYAAIFGVGGIQLPFFPLWLKAKGLDAQAIGLVLSVPMVVRVFIVPVIARQADRRDSLRTLIVASSCATVAGYLLVGLANAPVTIFLAFTLASLAYTPILPMAETYALRGLAAIGRAYGPVRLWGSLAFILGGFVAGFAVDRIPARDLIWLLVAAYALSALAAISLAELPPAPQRAQEKAARTGLLRDGVFLAVVISAGLTQASHAVYYSFSAVAWSAAGLDGKAIAALWGLGVLAEVLLFALSGRLPRSLGPLALLLIGAAGGAIRWAGMAFDPPAAALPWLQLLHGLSFGATHLGALGFVARHAPHGQSATAQGYLAIALGLMMAAMTGVSGLLYAAFGTSAYAAMALAAITGGACALIAQRLRREVAM
ncbi:MAG TPA: MFS transporter [Pseudolabrys sp.]|nr:MFS transporter [Pseudolabrys sp.]